MNSKSSSACLKGELVSENNREEPVCLKCSEGLRLSERLDSSSFVISRSSYACVVGRARQGEQWGSL